MAESNDKDHTEESIVVTGVGMVTPVGHESISGSAAIRAGISRFYEIPHFVTKTGAGATGGLVMGITDERSGSDRLLSMASLAASEALFQAEEFSEALLPCNGKLFLCMNSAERPAFEDFDSEDIRTLLEDCQLEDLANSVEIIRQGHAGGILALEKSMFLLRKEAVEFCVVGAVDSLVEYPSLNWLNELGRLKTDDHPEGFMPGEAAAFVVLELESSARRRGAPILAELVKTTFTSESATVLNSEPLRGVGLAQAIRQATQGDESQENEIHGIICDLNGEYYRMKEWALVLQKIYDPNKPLPELWFPAECIGDVGAASAVAFMVIAVEAIQKS